MTLKHLLRSARYVAGDVLEKYLLLLGIHEPKENSRLFPMIVFDAMIPVIGITFYGECWLGVFRLIGPQSCRIRVIVCGGAKIPVCTHGTVPVV
jgi:hypothetical protein